MIARLDETLEAFLRTAASLSAVDVDVSFEPPNEEWAAKLTRPTVNAYLWDIRRSANRNITGVEELTRDGVAYRRMALPRVDFRYSISVWTTEHEDERSLMTSLLLALLSNNEIPEIHIAEGLREQNAPLIHLSRSGEGDIFYGFDRMKVALHTCISLAVDTGPGNPVAPEVAEISLGMTDTESGASTDGQRRIAGEVKDPAAIGVEVRSPLAVTTVNPFGRFLINARAGDEIVVETDPPQTVIVPEVGGVVVGG